MTAFALRDYQREAITALLESPEGISRSLLVLPTGSGKTIVFASYLDQFLLSGERALVLAHREELLTQARDKIAVAAPSLHVEIEQADSRASHTRPGDSLFETKDRSVVVGSVASMRGKRLEGWPQDAFSVVIVDEAHHATADAYRDILTHFGCMDGSTRLVGVTATPGRTDGVGLGAVFEEIAYERTIREMIDDGYLVPIRAWQVDTSTDLRQVKTTAGDYNTGQLEDAVNNDLRNYQILSAYERYASGMQAVIFCAGVEHAQAITRSFNDRGVATETVWGDMGREKRAETLDRYQHGHTRVLTNFAVLCLDAETEILTSSGFVKMEEMTEDHLVANWDDSRIFFEKPLKIYRRERHPGERMIVYETMRRSIRVTERHRILFRHRFQSDWTKLPAIDLVGKDIELPVSGIARPTVFQRPDRLEVSSQRHSHLVSKTAYNLRKNNGTSWDDSFIEAERRQLRRESLCRKNPQDVSIDECNFIGFWLGDGTRAELSTGGVEYVISQSETYPVIISWFDALCEKLPYSVKRRRVKEKVGNPKTVNHIRWSFCRGTGGGVQERDGLYCIEPFLDKNGSELLWGLNEQQFDALLRGLWFADGNHGKGDVDKKTKWISSCNFTFLSLLQSIAVCRGYRASIRASRRKDRPQNHRVLYTLSFRKRLFHSVTSLNKTFEIEDGWKNEMVWCVQSSTGNIITRRHGSVTVLGNTEGWDAPQTQCIILARPTKSELLYTQMLGRGLRIHPNKDHMVAIDMADVSGGKSLINVSTLVGLPLKFDPKGGDVYKMAEDLEQIDPRLHRLTTDRETLDKIITKVKAGLSVAEIDLFAAIAFDETIKDISKFAWVSLGVDRWRIKCEKGMTYEIHVNTIGNYITQHMESKTIINTTNEKKRAFSAADRYIYNHHTDKMQLLDSSAAWRQTAASEKQIALVRSLAPKMEIPESLSKGDASMLIDSLMQGKRRRAS